MAGDDRDRDQLLEEEAPRRGLTGRTGGRFWVGLAVGALVVVAVALLIAQNPEPTAFEWLVVDFTAPLWTMLALSFAAGALTWTILALAVREARAQRRERSGATRAELRARRARSRRRAVG